MIIFIIIAALAVLILSHEFGHFLLAKLSGARVDEFGFGFPPRLFSFKKGETTYSLNLLPFGGFVKIFGEDSSEKQSRSFSSRPMYLRACILAAGVFFNLILAWLLFSLVLWLGAPTSVGSEAQDAYVTIIQVQPGTPAEEVGLSAGDRLLSFSSEGETFQVNSVLGVQQFVERYKGKEVFIEYLRGQKNMMAVAVPQINPPEGVGALGIAMDRVGIVSLPFYRAIWEGIKTTISITAAIVKAFYGILVDLFTSGGAAVAVMGPVGIMSILGTASGLGFVYVVNLIALLSINLAILNILPFPALDGGRLLFLAIEAVKGSPISQKVSAGLNTAGFLFLIALMLLVTYKDIAKLIHG
ncbi:MAG: hypothetical protein AUJ36_03425 [Parcubacteria group bacterium CG1_02_41_26]|nr:MAG: hypothetical protein AUJ36_03425 [Parcubacteria group bacterium CG1_02_41_26]